MVKNIYLFLELQGENLNEQSAEILGAALRIMPESKITAIVPQAKAEEVNNLPVDLVYYGGEEFPQFATAWAKAAADLEEADLILTPMTVGGRDFASAYAAEKALTYIPAVSGIKTKPAGLLITRITYVGLAQENALVQTPLVLGLIPEVWGIAPTLTGQPKLKQLTKPTTSYKENIKIEKTYTADWREMEINEGNIVVAGGMGMNTKENFDILYKLGEALSAPIGGSRVAEDKGWIEHKQMIGATGATINPKLYIACGISGAVQHAVGVQGSRHIIAINNDDTAAMMTNADLAVVSDAQETIKELVELLKDYSPVKEG